MIMGVFSIYDSKALVFHMPFCAQTDQAAARIVYDSMDRNSALARHPADYTVYRIGTYDDQTGAIAPVTPPLHVADVVSLLPKETQAEMFGLKAE